MKISENFNKLFENLSRICLLYQFLHILQPLLLPVWEKSEEKKKEAFSLNQWIEYNILYIGNYNKRFSIKSWQKFAFTSPQVVKRTGKIWLWKTSTNLVE